MGRGSLADLFWGPLRTGDQIISKIDICRFSLKNTDFGDFLVFWRFWTLARGVNFGFWGVFLGYFGEGALRAKGIGGILGVASILGSFLRCFLIDFGVA